VGAEDFGLAASQHVSPLAYDVEAEYLAFFRRWLLTADQEDWPAPIKIFTMGRNAWRFEASWPPDGAREERFYLHSGGAANTSAGDGTLSPVTPGKERPDEFVFRPGSPVPTTGGDLCCYPSKLAPGPLDQRTVEMRQDVLVYKSEPITETTEITGPVRLELWATTTAADTDFTAKLVKVERCGRTLNLTDGIIRATFRNGPEGDAVVTPGEPHLYKIDLGSTSIELAAGERFALEISSSNFPRFAVNETAPYATQRVLHDLDHPSLLILSTCAERAGSTEP
jgi:putative CocE/NonD family hydrolase